MTVRQTAVPVPGRHRQSTSEEASLPARRPSLEWLRWEISRCLDTWGRTLRLAMLVLLTAGCVYIAAAGGLYLLERVTSSNLATFVLR